MLGQSLNVREVESTDFMALFEPQSHFLSGKLLKEKLYSYIECGLPLAVWAGVVQLVEDTRAH